MRINTRSLLKHLLILIGLCLFVMPLGAQDADEAYNEALRRIEEARVSGATELDLSYLELESVPSEIGMLSNLEELTLSHNSLTELPAEIALLNNLKELSLTANAFVHWPNNINKLPQLYSVWIGNNQLTQLPDEVAQLQNLKSLGLEQNHLTEIPSVVFKHTKLVALSLYGNQITSIPAEIGNLPDLHWFWIQGNQLTTLPLELGQINTPYAWISVEDNPLTFPPVEIQAQGQWAILAYLRDYQAMLMRQTIAGVAAGVGGIAILILAFRWRQRRGLSEKKKR